LLEVLKKDEVEIHLSLSTEGSDKPMKVVKTTDFIEISTSIVNRLGKLFDSAPSEHQLIHQIVQ